MACFVLSLLVLIIIIVLNTSFPTLCSSQPIIISNLTTDQRALLAFKDSISGRVLTQNWSTNSSVCYWIGVSCGPKHPRVTALNVSGLGLKGTIAPHLGNLTFLRSLDVSTNNFTGSIPSELSKLRRLKAINLESNQITGTIPNGLFNNISSLEEMNMRDNRLSGGLPNDMCTSNYSPKLKKIYLTGNQLEGEIPANIQKCRELEDLRLGKNHFNGNIPSEIWSLPNLTILALYSNQLQGFSAHVGNVAPGIEGVYIYDNHLTGGIPSFLFNISSLKVLDLSSNSLSGSIPADTPYNLPVIQTLYLFSNSLTGGIPSFLFNISSLVFMDLSSNPLSGSIPTDTPYNLPVIQGLYLSKNNLTGGIPKQLGNLTSLIQLELASNKLTGELPHELGNLANMEVLQAPYNDYLSGSIPPSIFNISTLQLVTLQQNLFSGSLPSDLGLSLPSLEELVLSLNRLTGQIPTSIANASELTILELNLNSFSGSIPDFGTLRNLQHLRLWENNLTGAESPTQEMGFLSSLTDCRLLKYLEISNNPLNGILPASVGNLSTSLVNFWASGCEIQGMIPSEIGNLRSLQSLRLSENQLTGFIPTTIGELKQIRELDLGGNHLRGYIPRGLCQSSDLGVVYLYDNMLMGQIPDCIGELKSLTKLVLYSNKLNSTIPSGLWNLINLITLELSVNTFSGQISHGVGSLKALNNLDLSYNQFSGDIPISISGCQSLQSLNFSNNNFTGSIPESLGTNVRGLLTLNLSNNSLSGLIPKSLANISGLQNFDVSYNELDGEIPNGGPFDNFTAQSFSHNFALCGEAALEVPPCPNGHGRSRSKKKFYLMTKYGAPTFLVVIILVAVILIVIRRRKQGTKTPLSPENSLKTTACRRVSYIELYRGTSSFSETNLLGKGSFGSVFKATLSDGLHIAVKVFNLQLEGAAKSFDTESEILSTIRHRNLVPVIGCCTNTEFKALILEYMQNGSLEKWLHYDGHGLDLMRILNIATDVALALEYLHHGHTFPIVHCDIKPSNVLLDEDMTAHVGDFGISKLFDEGEKMIQTTTLATVGYAAPEYGSEGKVSTNGDVYSYGIMLLEMLTRKRPTDDMFSGEMSLKEWVCENEVIEVVAPGLLSSEDLHFSAHGQCVSSCIELAMKCLAFSPNERSNMVQVVAALHKIKSRLIAATQVNIMRRQ